jgi:hypothetical protein
MANPAPLSLHNAVANCFLSYTSASPVFLHGVVEDSFTVTSSALHMFQENAGKKYCEAVDGNFQWSLICVRRGLFWYM